MRHAWISSRNIFNVCHRRHKTILSIWTGKINCDFRFLFSSLILRILRNFSNWQNQRCIQQTYDVTRYKGLVKIAVGQFDIKVEATHNTVSLVKIIHRVKFPSTKIKFSIESLNREHHVCKLSLMYPTQNPVKGKPSFIITRHIVSLLCHV